MKKIYILLSIMVLSLMTAGFSYAYWSDTLTVNGTAETGDLEVIFTQEEEINKPAHVTSNNVVAPKQFTVELDKLYPGAVYQTSVEVENTGTIPAILDYVELLNADQNDLSQYIQVTLEFVTGPNTPNPVRTVTLDQAPVDMLPQLGLLLDVDGQDSFGWMNVTVEVLSGAGNNTMDKTVDFTLQLNFVQFNAYVESNEGGPSGGGDVEDTTPPVLNGYPVSLLTHQGVTLTTDPDARIQLFVNNEWVDHDGIFTDSGIYTVRAIDNADIVSGTIVFEIDLIVYFPDPVLNAQVRQMINKHQGDIIYQSDLEHIQKLTVIYMPIITLEGIQYLENLKILDLVGNGVEDISALSTLTNLDILVLDSNEVQDISALSTLTNLTELYLFDNNITDISALRTLEKLEALVIGINGVEDISVLNGLLDLRYVDLSFNPLNPDAMTVIDQFQQRGVFVIW